MVISSLNKHDISASGRRTCVSTVRDGQDTIEKNHPPFTNELVDPEQSDTTHGEATEKTGGDVT
jgi:hypothetical protein